MSQLDQLETKDPGDKKEYSVLWGRHLESDTIATSTWTVPTGITKDSDEHGPQTATIWLSGGTVDTDYQITNRVTTNSTPSRTLDQTITIRVRSR